MNKEEFEKIKPKVLEEFEQAFLRAFHIMGENISGVDWFSSSSDIYNVAYKNGYEAGRIGTKKVILEHLSVLMKDLEENF